MKIAIKIKKYHLIIAVTALICIALLVLSCNFNYFLGYFRDEHPEIEYPSVIGIVAWMAVLFPLIVPISSILMSRRIKEKSLPVSVIHLIVIVIVSAMFIICLSVFNENYYAPTTFG